MHGRELEISPKSVQKNSDVSARQFTADCFFPSSPKFGRKSPIFVLRAVNVVYRNNMVGDLKAIAVKMQCFVKNIRSTLRSRSQLASYLHSLTGMGCSSTS